VGGHAAQRKKIVGLEKLNTVFPGQASAGKYLIFDLIDAHFEL
jgi:hypothetical protein